MTKQYHEARCSMCGATYIYDGTPPCEVWFLDKKFRAALCYGCAVKITQFIKTYRQRRSWKDMVV